MGNLNVFKAFFYYKIIRIKNQRNGWILLVGVTKSTLSYGDTITYKTFSN